MNERDRLNVKEEDFMKAVKRIAIFGLALLGLYVVSIVIEGYHIYHDALTETAVVDKFTPIQQREDFVTIAEVPPIYKDAVLTIEDRRFYQHFGIDVLAIIRAFFNDVIALSFVEGGSTITQQVAKNEYFTQDKELTRKVAEAFMAIEIEKHYSKDEIFEIYMNTIYFGEGYYGIAAASEGYYAITPAQMNDYQSTLLAGVPNAPSVYAPTVNPDLAAERQNQVLQRMIKYGVISEERAAEIRLGIV